MRYHVCRPTVIIIPIMITFVIFSTVGNYKLQHVSKTCDVAAVNFKTMAVLCVYSLTASGQTSPRSQTPDTHTAHLRRCYRTDDDNVDGNNNDNNNNNNLIIYLNIIEGLIETDATSSGAQSGFGRVPFPALWSVQARIYTRQIRVASRTCRTRFYLWSSIPADGSRRHSSKQYSTARRL